MKSRKNHFVSHLQFWCDVTGSKLFNHLLFNHFGKHTYSFLVLHPTLPYPALPNPGTSLNRAPFFSCCHTKCTLIWTKTCSLIVQMKSFQYRLYAWVCYIPSYGHPQIPICPDEGRLSVPVWLRGLLGLAVCMAARAVGLLDSAVCTQLSYLLWLSHAATVTVVLYQSLGQTPTLPLHYNPFGK